MADEMKKNIDNEELNLEQLKNVSGGATIRDPGMFYQFRFSFNENEVKVIKEKKGLSLDAYREYSCSNLRDLGGTASEIKAYLKSIGINVEEIKY